MENNSDKFLREKLSNTEFPFDPKAWEQMEAMLDKKKKRRVFFWWWIGGAAAALLLLVSVLAGLEQHHLKQKTNATDHLAANRPANKHNQTEQNKQVGLNTVTSQINIEEVSPNAQGKQNYRQNNGTEQHHAHKAAVVTGQNRKLNKPTQAHKQKTKRQLQVLAQHTAHQRTPLQHMGRQAINPYRAEVNALRSGIDKPGANTENISLLRYEQDALQYVSESTITGFEKKEETVLPTKKRKLFSYSLGMLANISGSTLGNQAVNQAQRPALFYKTPSYMLGLTHDFLFINRIALSNSILFSQTSFEVHRPKSESFMNPPISYTSHINEMAISIGIKAYPVATNNFRFYISTGIINHIKLKETFKYSAPVDSNVNLSSTPNLPADAFYPTQTNFGSKENSYDALNNGGLSNTVGSNSTSDFSMNKAKRYYASFYAGAGFEYVARQRFVIFAEPTFYMSLQKIGVQDKRKYNVGLNAGFRYRF